MDLLEEKKQASRAEIRTKQGADVLHMSDVSDTVSYTQMESTILISIVVVFCLPPSRGRRCCDDKHDHHPSGRFAAWPQRETGARFLASRRRRLASWVYEKLFCTEFDERRNMAFDVREFGKFDGTRRQGDRGGGHAPFLQAAVVDVVHQQPPPSLSWGIDRGSHCSVNGGRGGA